MRLISSGDDEVFGLVSAAAKLGRAGKLLDRLADAYQANPAGPTDAGPTDATDAGPTDATDRAGATGTAGTEAAFRYGLALMALVRPGIEAHARLTDAIEVFGEVLDAEPEHWLARYSRARLRALVPGSYGSFTAQAPDELDQAGADLDILLAQQDRLARRDRLAHQPYFASAHALAAVVDRTGGEESAARAAARLAALTDWPRVPVRLPALGAILCEPLITLHARDTDPDRRESIGELMTALYGDQRAVREARAGIRPSQPVR